MDDDSPGPIGAVVIVGAGHAGAQVARSLRGAGYAGRLTLVGDEAWPPYERPPLSKAFLGGPMPTERLVLTPESVYAGKDIALRLGDGAVAIDRAACRVRLASGDALAYDRLVLATGARPRRLPLAEGAPIRTLRTIEDALALRTDVVAGRRLVVVGAGYIGLEVAATARKLGARVTVVEAADRVMARTSSPEISALFEAAHRASGVVLVKGAVVAGVEDGAVALADGGRIEADAVLVGIGVEAQDELAREAGLDCADGILVDATMRTSDPLVFAVGDVAKPLVDGARVRFEAISTATAQAKAAAAAMLGLAPPRAEVPWFWSDQYDLRLQSAGLIAGADRSVVRRREDGPGLAVLHARGDRLIAVEAVNDVPDFLAGRNFIRDGVALDLDRGRNGEMTLAEAAGQARDEARVRA